MCAKKRLLLSESSSSKAPSKKKSFNISRFWKFCQTSPKTLKICFILIYAFSNGFP